MQARRGLAILLAALALHLGGPLAAPLGATPSEVADAITGADTPQSLALAKELQGILDQRVKIQAQMRELINKRQPITDLSKQMSELVQAAYKTAEEMADARAKGAIDQRCVKPSEATQPAGTATGASAFVSPQVLAGGTTGGNDPWLVCASARRYLIGAKKEIEQIRGRNRLLVNRALPDSQVPGGYPLTQEEFDYRFRTAEIVDVDYTVREVIEPAIRRIQRMIAQDRVSGALSDKAPRLRSMEELFDGNDYTIIRGDSYDEVQNAIAMAWLAHSAEAGLKVDFLQQSINERQSAEANRSYALMKALWDGDVRDNGPYIAIAQQYDRKALPFVLAKAQELRVIAAEVKESRLRLMQDAKAWKDFAAKDGNNIAATGYADASFANFVVRQFMGNWSLVVGFHAWRENMLGTMTVDGYAANREWIYALPGVDPNDYEASLTRAVQQLLPEGKGGSAGTLMISHRINTNDIESIQAVASGAGDAESP
jgi:hypothetical protein